MSANKKALKVAMLHLGPDAPEQLNIFCPDHRVVYIPKGARTHWTKATRKGGWYVAAIAGDETCPNPKRYKTEAKALKAAAKYESEWDEVSEKITDAIVGDQ